MRSGQQFVIDDIGVVVPQESPVPGRLICQKRHRRQNDSENQRATARRKDVPRYTVHTLPADDHN